MKAWAKGDQAVAAKVDPTIATIVAAIANILVRFNLHDKLGMSPEDLLTTLLDFAFILLMARSIQINLSKANRKPAPAPAPADPPSSDPPSDVAA